MKVKAMTNRNLPVVHHKISEGATSVSYRTVDGRVLKRFYLNEMYKRLLEYHNGDFLAYLKELSKIESELLVPINEVYVNSNNLVGGYSYDYQAGNTLNDLHPRTKLINLRNALVNMDQELRSLQGIKLDDTHYRNIIYTGDIRLIDLDFSTLTDADVIKKNVGHVNKYVLFGLFGILASHDMKVDKRLRSIFKATIHGDAAAYEFLDEYMDLVEREVGECTYYKQLTKRYVEEKEKKRLFF